MTTWACLTATWASGKAGMLPYLALLAGALVVLSANWFFVLPGTERMAFGDYLMQPLTWFSSTPAE